MHTGYFQFKIMRIRRLYFVEVQVPTGTDPCFEECLSTHNVKILAYTPLLWGEILTPNNDDDDNTGLFY